MKKGALTSLRYRLYYEVLNDTFRVDFYSSYTDNMLLAINEDKGILA